MITNVGRTDKLVRFAIAAVALVGAFLSGLGSVPGIVMLVVAAIMAGTALSGFCPIYRLFGMNTCPVKQH